jgi:hypothetical protein
MTTTFRVAAVALLALAAPAWPQDQPQSPPAKPVEPGTPASEPPKDPPTLDELLGIGGEPRPAEGEDVPPGDTTRADLDRELSGKEAAEQFREAIGLMGETAERIKASRDTGLGTQRLQEDIIRKLDMVIRSAERQQSSKQQSSSSSKAQDPKNQPSQQRQGSQGQQNQGENRDEREPPPRQEGALNPEIAARGAAWGALPERVRDALLQGNEDRYSAMYRKLTEAYYKRLAEEAPR